MLLVAPSLSPGWSLDTASPDEISVQIRFELHQVLERTGYTQEQLMLEVLGRESSSSYSKWMNGNPVLTWPGAEDLDAKVAEIGQTTTGHTFRQLLTAYHRRPPARTEQFVYDVFLAAPMAATDAEPGYKKARQEALDLQAALGTHCGHRVYYAGNDIYTPDEFDSTDLSAEVNFARLQKSKYFVLLMRETLIRPSSVWLEAGYALALKIPSLYLVNELSALPFVARTLNGHTVPDLLPRVRIEVLAPNQRSASLIQRQGKGIFEKLSDPM